MVAADPASAYITTGTVLAIAGAIIGYLISKKMERWDVHLEECRKKSIDHARLEEKVIAITDNVEALKEHVDLRADALEDSIYMLHLQIAGQPITHMPGKPIPIRHRGKPEPQ